MSSRSASAEPATDPTARPRRANLRPWPLQPPPVTVSISSLAEAGEGRSCSAAIGDASVNDIAAGTLLYRLLTWLVPIPVGFVVLARWRIVANRESSGIADSG